MMVREADMIRTVLTLSVSAAVGADLRQDTVEMEIPSESSLEIARRVAASTRMMFAEAWSLELAAVHVTMTVAQVERRVLVHEDLASPRSDGQVMGFLTVKGPFWIVVEAIPDKSLDADSPLAKINLPAKEMRAPNLGAARAAGLKFIRQHSLGPGNWTGGAIYDARHVQVAHMSFNGRVWSVDGKSEFVVGH